MSALHATICFIECIFSNRRPSGIVIEPEKEAGDEMEIASIPVVSLSSAPPQSVQAAMVQLPESIIPALAAKSSQVKIGKWHQGPYRA